MRINNARINRNGNPSYYKLRTNRLKKCKCKCKECGDIFDSYECKTCSNLRITITTHCKECHNEMVHGAIHPARFCLFGGRRGPYESGDLDSWGSIVRAYEE